MSTTTQMRMVVEPKPEGIVWDLRDDTRRFGYGSVATLEEIRGVEIRSGVALVQLIGRYVTAGVMAQAEVYGWEVAS